MNFRHFALAAALILAAGLPAGAADKESWVGAWGFVPTPLPPGTTPTVPASPLAAATPLANLAVRTTAVTVPTPPPPLLDNPGNVPVVVTPDSPPTNITLRQLVRVAVAGKRIRLRFTNEGGAGPLLLGAVHVAEAGPDGAALPGTDKVVTFDGNAGTAVPDGAPLYSDPVALPVAALDKLVVSTYVLGAIPLGGHSLYQYVAGVSGDQAGAAQLPNQKIMRLTSFVSQVEVDSPATPNVVVTFGDSITEGATSTNNAFRGWPDRLAERLAAARSKWSVVNAGIGGNRLLRYGTGPNALARLDRDVFAVPGAKVLILLEGINDIGRGFTTQGAQEPVTAEALIAADRQIIARCHEHGIKVIGATLTPYQGAAYEAPGGEEVRSALNKWIMTSGAFDGVVDFAAATADAANPLAFRAGFNIRDHLHPNDAGYRAMGDAIDLSLITGK